MFFGVNCNVILNLRRHTCKVMFIGASVLIVRWSSLCSVKNVDVAWRLIDVMKE